jgi:hypothetical protein
LFLQFRKAAANLHTAHAPLQKESRTTEIKLRGREFSDGPAYFLLER